MRLPVCVVSLGLLLPLAAHGQEEAAPEFEEPEAPAAAPVENTNPCEGVTCSNHGKCVVKGGEPVCACHEGYKADHTGLGCSRQPDFDVPTDVSTEPTSTILRIATVPPGRNVSLDHTGRWRIDEGSWHPAPVEFPVDPGPHTLHVRGVPGYRNTVISFSAVSPNMDFEIELDRPVFEAGVGMFVSGFVVIGSGLAFIAKTVVPIMVAGPIGGAMAISGVVMMIADKSRTAEVRADGIGPRIAVDGEVVTE